jgi:hypothetical protein
MVWSITDRVIEDPTVREMEFRDLQKAGFGGVAAFVRCSRYSWYDAPARKALAHISRLCRSARLSFWFGPDPRFVSHILTRDTGGLEIVLFGNASRADIWPNLAEISNGRYTTRCILSPRHVHTLTDVAITYSPVGLARVYAVQNPANDGLCTDIRDITRHARMFHNARDGYLEAFGTTGFAAEQGWKVCAFVHVRSSHVDFSSARQLTQYEAMLGGLRRDGCMPDGLMWDEPGFTCTYGSLPFSPAIRRRYHSACGRTLENDLWKLAFKARDRSHEKVRKAYYGVVQSSVTLAEKRFRKASLRLWGPGTTVGIHDTWHFESGDMCDMNHGSMNLWQTVSAKSGGFVDLGGIQQLNDPDAPWQANHAAMTVIAASLGRRSREQCAYNNLWTVGDDNGDGSQGRAMGHCVQTMALFGIRWLAHAYGPVGTIGQERTFLGSPPLPGYPEHSTWTNFPAWNRFLREELEKVHGRLPSASLGVVFPVESLYARAGREADDAAAALFRLLLMLLDNHYHVGVIASTDLSHSRWAGGHFELRHESFDALVVPYPAGLPASTLRRLKGPAGRTLFAFESSSSGGKIRPGLRQDEIIPVLSALPELRPVDAPEDCWVTMTPQTDGTVVSLAPSRCGGSYAGDVRYRGRVVRLSDTRGLIRIFFPGSGEPKIITS